MRHEFYDYSQDEKGRYRFTSRGKRAIVKIVEFALTSRTHLRNLWFGDMLSNDTIDDMVISNNGDIRKVLATVIKIIREFTLEQPHITVVFKGSTVGRMDLYHRILKTHYAELRSEFIISAFVLEENAYTEVLFDPDSNAEYWAFFIKKNI